MTHINQSSWKKIAASRDKLSKNIELAHLFTHTKLGKVNKLTSGQIMICQILSLIVEVVSFVKLCLRNPVNNSCIAYYLRVQKY